MKTEEASRAPNWIGAALLSFTPQAFALLAFLCGAVLLLTSAFPALAPRMAALSQAAPLLVIELSHFLASLIGLLLLVVAAGLWRKREGAYIAALALLCAGVVFALLRGLDFEEAGLLALVAIGLYFCRGAFVRKSRLMRETLTAPWFIGIGATLAAICALGFFAYREVPYTDELFWTFLRDGDASRFLRGAVAVAALAAVIAAMQLFSSPRTRYRGAPAAQDVARAAAIIARAERARPDAQLARTADKDFLFSESGESFLMFATRGRRWIAMGAPCGKASEHDALLWRFAELADEAGALPVFYALRSDDLGAVAELGFIARKIGETALVPVQSFSLDGKGRQNLRTARNKLEREGCGFEVCAPGAAPMADLKAVSDSWLARHAGAEKRFSMGRFDPDYIAAQPIAIVRQNDRIIAFANIWQGVGHGEIAIDLMRHAADAPKNAMDYLFVKLIEWAKAEGYGALDLGMAPLAGLERRRLAPAMTQIGAAVFEEGGQIYGFRGLRAYKEKFGPHWRAMFLAAPPQVFMPLALLDVALLTSGGWRGLLGLRPKAAGGNQS